MTLLLTGANGFLGSHLARALLSRGDTVLAYKRPNSDLSRLSSIVDNIEWFDFSLPTTPFASARPIDAVIHLATCYGRNRESAAEMIAVNTKLPVALYEHCASAKVGTFINVHTALPRDVNPYSLSKHHLVDWLALIQGKTRVLHLRMEHFYGPGDDSAKFIEWLFARLLTGKSIPLTKGEQQRDFLYIDDAISAILTCLDQSRTAFASNDLIDIGSGQAVTIRDLAELCKKLLGSQSSLDFGKVPYRENELMKSVADVTRLCALGWTPGTTLKSGLRAVCDSLRKS